MSADLGDEAPNYASVQRWSKRFRDAVDSPLGSPLASQSNFETRDTRSNQELDVEDEQHSSKRQTQINANAKHSESTTSAVSARHSFLLVTWSSDCCRRRTAANHVDRVPVVRKCTNLAHWSTNEDKWSDSRQSFEWLAWICPLSQE